MKNTENAFAPAAVWAVAAIGITGGFSFLVRRFLPVRGTSAGTVGRTGLGAVLTVVGVGLVVETGVEGAGVVTTATELVVLELEVGVGLPLPDVHPATDATAAVNARPTATIE